MSFSMLGLAELRGHLSDVALIARVDARLSVSTARARAQQAIGGWGVNGGGGSPDPLTSAWVGFALDTLEPQLTDPVGARQHRVHARHARAEWHLAHTTSGLFGTHLATTSLVMATCRLRSNIWATRISHWVIWNWSNRGEYIARRSLQSRPGAATGGISVRFFDGPPTSACAREASSTASTAARHAGFLFRCPPERRQRRLRHLTPTDEIGECLTTNNATSALLVQVRASDPDALFDLQRYLLNVDDANAARS